MESINNPLATATAVITLVTVAMALVVSLRNRKQVKEIHVLVNHRMDEVLGRVDQLTETLQDAGIDIPIDLRQRPSEQS